ncbi:GGDEF domain-containing protein [Ectothiorhodospiraceae bacterium WFHF3C12]|nr:GGDEF domain-containing protein [Ectothiorhodospiraceae bacterium WFHF3C12]
MLWLAVLLALTLPGAAAEAAAPAEIDLETAPQALKLGPRARILEVSGGEPGVRDLIAGVRSADWRPSRQETLNFSFSDSAYWLRFRFTNSGDQTRRRLIVLGMPLHDYLDIHVVDSGHVARTVSTGDRRPFDSRPLAHSDFVMELSVPAGQARDVYMRLDTHDGLYDATPLWLLEDGVFFARAQKDLLLYGVYYGVLLALLAYNLLLFASLRERPFLLYGLYLAAFFVWNFTFRGYAFQFWWPDWPTLNNQMVAIAGSLIYVALTAFTNDFLELRRSAPRMRWLLFALTAVIGLTLLPALAGMYAFTFAMLIPAGILYLVFIYAMAWVLALRGNAPARIYVLAWSVLIVGAVLYYLRVLGWLPSNFVTENALQIGSGLECVLLAFGLAHKIHSLNQRQLDAEMSNAAFHKRLSLDLEAKVRERTMDLEAANARLQEMASTDELTGLSNRRRFNERFQEEYKRRQRSRAMLCFCILDIDHFKEYNDTYGHHAGDEVLQRVATLLSHHFRRAGDQLFRLGGEEFGVLLDAEAAEQAIDRVEAVRRALVEEGIPHRRAAEGVLTASFGLICARDYAAIYSTGRAYQEADDALYEAKSMGRNCLVFRLFDGGLDETGSRQAGQGLRT